MPLLPIARIFTHSPALDPDDAPNRLQTHRTTPDPRDPAEDDPPIEDPSEDDPFPDEQPSEWPQGDDPAPDIPDQMALPHLQKRPSHRAIHRLGGARSRTQRATGLPCRVWGPYPSVPRCRSIASAAVRAR
jgi:hypothetical protein